jgi:hypothetical protein
MINEIKRNQRWHNMKTGQTARIMGIVENYVVLRNKGCSAFLLHTNDFYKVYELADDGPQSRIKK